MRATVGTPYHYAVTATDPEGDALLFSLANPPADMTIDPDTGVVTLDAAAAQTGPQR